MTDYYKILGVDKSASQDEIKRAYRKLSIKYHPDKNDGDKFFENMFKQLQEAYEVLGNQQNRYDYDRGFGRETYQEAYREDERYSAFEPVIEYFTADKVLLYSGDEIRFSWKTYNADVVEINPFGSVSTSGTKVFRLNYISRKYVKVELKATNSAISKYVTQQIMLENKIFRDAANRDSSNSEYSKSTASSQYTAPSNIKTEKFLSIKGRLRRQYFFVRILLLTLIFCFTILFGVASEDADKMVISIFIGLVLIILSAIQAIKRLHDLNISGVWVLLVIIPYVNLIIGFIMLVASGTKGPNNYGPDPRGT